MKEISFLLCFFALIGVFTSCEDDVEHTLSEKFEFMAHGVSFSVGDDADYIISQLGKPNSFSSAPSCAEMGIDELYGYNGFRFTTHRDSGNATVTSIEITNDTLETLKGVSIGDSADEVKEKYGKGREFSGGVEYVGQNCALRFFLRDGRVTSIQYVENES